MKNLKLALFAMCFLTVNIYAGENMNKLYNVMKQKKGFYVELKGNTLIVNIKDKSRSNYRFAKIFKNKKNLKNLLEITTNNKASILCKNPFILNIFKNENGKIIYRYHVVQLNPKAKYEVIIDYNTCLAYEKFDNNYQKNELNEATEYSYKNIQPYVKNLKNISAEKTLKKKLGLLKGKRIDAFTIITDTKIDLKNKTAFLVSKMELINNASEQIKNTAQKIEQLPNEVLERILKNQTVNNLQIVFPSLYDLIKEKNWKAKYVYYIGDKTISFTIKKTDLK